MIIGSPGDDALSPLRDFMRPAWRRFSGAFSRLVLLLGLASGLLRGGPVALDLGAATTNWLDQEREFVVRTWGIEAGLPQNTVTSIIQARNGYLWLGTLAGLARFDGVRFKVFGLADGLPNLQVRSLFEDDAGDLWIGTINGGLCRLRAGRIEPISGAGISGDETITSLIANSQGHLWVGSNEGLLLWDQEQLLHHPTLTQLPRNFIRTLLKSRDGTIWVATANELYSWRNETLTRETGPAPDTNIVPYCLLEDQRGRLWASIGNGKILCRQADGAWTRYDQTAGVPFAYVTSLAEDNDGTIWAGSLDAGLYYFKDERFHPIPDRAGLSDRAVRSLCVDREGNLWIGHRTSGLDRLTASKLVTLDVDSGLTNDYVRSVAEAADGQLWVGTTGGGMYRSETGGLRLLTNTTYNAYYPFVETILTTRNGSVWWGGVNSLLCWRSNQLAAAFTSPPQTWTPPSQTPEWMIGATVSALLESQSGAIWVGTYQGKVIRIRAGQTEVLPHHLGRGAITCFQEEADGTLWTGSLAGGLSRLQADQVTTFTAKDGLPSSHVRVLHRSANGVLWIGTGGAGLVRFQNGRFQNFSIQQGLGDDTISQILEDDQGDLWLGCNRGIFRINRFELEELAGGRRTFLHPQAFGRNAGMLAEECTGGSSPAACQLRSGALAFATVKGVVIIDPRHQEYDSVPPKVLLEEVRADRQLVPINHSARLARPDAPATVTIPAGRRDCEFQYTGLSFRSPERVRFRFKLFPVDGDWVEADTRRVARYSPLSPGKYEFRVTACNSAGVWSPQEVVLRVNVLPRFWETGWFRLLLGLGFSGLLVGGVSTLVRQRYQQRLALLELQNAVARERLRISQDMHDHIGGLLTRVSILSDVGQDENEAPAVREQFGRIGDQVRAAVQGLDEIVWATNPHNDNLPRFAEYIGRFADECFEGTKVRCWHDLPEELPNLAVRADLRHGVFLAIKEACNNALKHSGASEVWLRLKLRGAQVQVEIEDNGRGFDPQKVAPGGNGLGNIASRLAECGGQAAFISTPGKGTRVRLTFNISTPRNE